MTEHDLTPRESELVRWAGASIQVLVHDVRNHLTRVLGEAQMLALKTGGAPGVPPTVAADVAARCDRISRAVRECDAMMARFQVVYREQKADPRALPLTALVRDAVAGLSEAERERIEVSVAPELSVQGDLVLSPRAIGECLRNALAAGAPDGIVQVAAATCEDGIVLRIEDAGVGMAAEVLEQACVPFYSGWPGTHRAGIGLAVCERAMGIVGGRFEIASAGPGMGTVARLVFAPPR